MDKNTGRTHSTWCEETSDDTRRLDWLEYNILEDGRLNKGQYIISWDCQNAITFNANGKVCNNVSIRGAIDTLRLSPDVLKPEDARGF